MAKEKYIGEALLKDKPTTPLSFKFKEKSVKTKHIDDKAVTNGQIDDNAVTERTILDSNVTNSKIADGAVTSGKIGTGEVKTSNIGDGQVTSVKIGTGEVKTANIAGKAVTTAKIDDEAVNTAQIHDGAVSTNKIYDRAVTSGKIGVQEVHTENIKDLNVTTPKLADGNVTWGKLSNDAKSSISNMIDDAADDITNRLMRDVNTIMSDYRPIEISGNVNNAADEEDLTSVSIGGTDVIRLKDKAYAPTIYSGLGKKYMRKNMVGGVNILTQSMMPTETGDNTIYVIQYDYDLNEQTLTIPDNSTLEFDGGSIRNGTINIGKGSLIKSENTKIFYDVQFTGNISNQFFNIDWFVANYAESMDDSEPDATAEVQAMFNCGIRKVWLTNNHFYRLTDTVVVPANVIINGNRQSEGVNYNNSKSFFGTIHDGPLMTIKALSGQNLGVSIYNLYLYRRVNASSNLNAENEYKRGIPTLYIDCSEGSIWGFEFWGVINSNKIDNIYYDANGGEHSETWGGYTGIEVYKGKGGMYFYFAKFDGNINNHHEAIWIHGAPTASNTGGVDLNCETHCGYGGRIDSRCVITGYHQTTRLFPWNSYSYFEISGACLLTGTIWDFSYNATQNNNKLFTVRYAVTASSFEGNVTHGGLNANNFRTIKHNLTDNILGNVSLGADLLGAAFYRMPTGVGVNDGSVVYKVFETDEDYEAYENGDTTKGIAVTKDNTYNYNYLFYPERLYRNDATGYVKTYNRDKKAYVKDTPTKVAMLSFTTCWLNKAAVVVLGVGTNLSNIQITAGGVTRTYTQNTYFNPIVCPIVNTSGSDKTTVVVRYKSAVTNVGLPYIGLCGSSVGNLIGTWGGSVYGALRINGLYNCINGNTREILHHNSFHRYIGDGSSDGVYKLIHLKFTSDNRGTVILKYKGDINILFCYNGTWSSTGYFTRNKVSFKAFKKGSNEFVLTSGGTGDEQILYVTSRNGCTLYDDLDSIDLKDTTQWTEQVVYSNELVVSGTSDVRNTLWHDNNAGRMFFDTGLNKMLFSNGTSWVDGNGFSPHRVVGTTAQRNSIVSADQGYGFYDTTINRQTYYTFKNVYFNNWVVAGKSTRYEPNPFTEGTSIRITVASTVTSIYFRLCENSDGTGASYDVTKQTVSGETVFTFDAPDASVYGYMELKVGTSSEKTYNAYQVLKYWTEQDGATAGVLRSGITTLRPNGGDIYVGFMYMDTSIGAPIWASAINGDTVTWVKADGTDPDNV